MIDRPDAAMAKYFAKDVSKSLFKERVRKFTRFEFEEKIKGAHIKGGIEICDYLLCLKEDNITFDELLGELHILRCDLWNAHCEGRPYLKKVTLEDCMPAKITPEKLVKK